MSPQTKKTSRATSSRSTRKTTKSSSRKASTRATSARARKTSDTSSADESSFFRRHESGHYVDPEGRIYYPYLEWRTPAFVDHQHGFLWYSVVVLFFTSLAVYFTFQADFVPAFVIGLLETVVLLHAIEDPREIRVRIDDDGIIVDQSRYDFDSIQYFWFDYLHGDIVLSFNLHRSLANTITVPLNGMDYQIVQSELGVYLQEDESRELGFAEMLGRKLKI